MFCLISSSLQISLKTFEVNLVSWSNITHSGSPTKGNTCSRYSLATSQELISSWHGSKITALVQSWSVIVSMESYPFDTSNLTIKSIAMVKNGHACYRAAPCDWTALQTLS